MMMMMMFKRMTKGMMVRRKLVLMITVMMRLRLPGVWETHGVAGTALGITVIFSSSNFIFVICSIKQTDIEGGEAPSPRSSKRPKKGKCFVPLPK